MTTVYISFSAEINPSTTETLIAVLADQVNKGATHIYLLFSTPGGSVMNGMNIYNVLKALPVDLTIHNVGNVDSIGNAIFLAGKNRFACEHSTFMFHGVGFDVPAQQRLEQKALKELLGGIESDQKRIGSIITANTGIKNNEVRALFLQAQTKDAAWALSKGIVHKVVDAQIPAGAPVIPLVFQR